MGSRRIEFSRIVTCRRLMLSVTLQQLQSRGLQSRARDRLRVSRASAWELADFYLPHFLPRTIRTKNIGKRTVAQGEGRRRGSCPGRDSRSHRGRRIKITTSLSDFRNLYQVRVLSASTEIELLRTTCFARNASFAVDGKLRVQTRAPAELTRASSECASRFPEN